MRPAKDAGRLSCLALNPRNREASRDRRIILLRAFSRLPEDDRADLLEALVPLLVQPEAGCQAGGHRLDAGWDDGRSRS